MNKLTINRRINGNPAQITLTEEEMLMAHRAVRRQGLAEDAGEALTQYCHENWEVNLSALLDALFGLPNEFVEFFFETTGIDLNCAEGKYKQYISLLADRFDAGADCGRAETDVWTDLFDDYRIEQYSEP